MKTKSIMRTMKTIVLALCTVIGIASCDGGNGDGTGGRTVIPGGSSSDGSSSTSDTNTSSSAATTTDEQCSRLVTKVTGCLPELESVVCAGMSGCSAYIKPDAQQVCVDSFGEMVSSGDVSQSELNMAMDMIVNMSCSELATIAGPSIDVQYSIHHTSTSGEALVDIEMTVLDILEVILSK